MRKGSPSKPKSTNASCHVLDEVEEKLVECKASLASEGYPPKEDKSDLKKLFDKLRTSLGCPIRRSQKVKSAYKFLSEYTEEDDDTYND